MNYKTGLTIHEFIRKTDARVIVADRAVIEDTEIIIAQAFGGEQNQEENHL